MVTLFPLKTVWVLFSSVVCGWVGGRAESQMICRKNLVGGCILESISYRKFLLSADTGCGMCVTSLYNLDLTFDLVPVTPTCKSCPCYVLETVKSRKLILALVLVGSISVQCQCDLDLIYDLAIVI